MAEFLGGSKRSDARAFDRNLGFWGYGEQDALSNATVAIAGAGGDGYQLGLKLAQMGVRNLRVADPETFEEENGNRVPGATLSNVGRNKAEAFLEAAENLPARPKVTIYTEGITPDNIEEFVQGADLVLDESELTMPELGTMLAREARRNNIPELLVMNIGFSAIATSFRPDPRRGVMGRDATFESLMGIPEDMPLDEVAKRELDFGRCLPYLPPNADLQTLIAVQNGASLPSISVGVDVAAAIGSAEAFKHLAGGVQKGWDAPIWAPRFRYFDAMTNRAGVTSRFPRLSYARRAGTMAFRSSLGFNPRAAYSDEEREARKARQAAFSPEVAE